MIQDCNPLTNSEPLLRELEILKSLATEAGALILRHRAVGVTVSHKEHGEVVTQADRDANDLILAGLKTTFPDDAIYSEETIDSPERLSKTRVWIVDPLDGTSNYIEGGDEWCVSIGLAINKRPVLGVVYNPTRNELFSGGEGLGVNLNGAAVKVSEAEDLKTSRILISRKEWKGGLTHLSHLASSISLIPVASMAYKLARVAAGLDDGVVSKKSRKEWGTCAGIALVLAAGGKATLLNGTEIYFNRAELKQPLGFTASGTRLHPFLLDAAKILIPLQ